MNKKCKICSGVGQVWSEERNELVDCDCISENYIPYIISSPFQHHSTTDNSSAFASAKQMKFHTAHMEAAIAYSKISHCNRAKVGALLVSGENRPLLSGYNGTAAGQDNCCEEEVEIACDECSEWNYLSPLQNHCTKCNDTKIITVIKTKSETHHAERNLLGYANKYGIATDGCSMYVTLQPCIECAKQIHLAGIVAVYFKDEYRDKSGVNYLKQAGVIIDQIKI